MLRFDHPLSERVRSLIRIEHLFNRFIHTIESDDKWSHHVALATLFEIMECSSRAELKRDILQELERQRQVGKHQNNAELLARLNHASQDLKDVQQKFGQHIRENEWLMAVKQRMLVAGGTTPVEMPSYYFWQKQDADKRRSDLRQWSEIMMPTHRAVCLLLDILRGNRREEECCAANGSFEHSSLAQAAHLLTIEVPIGADVLPEVSANKYFTHVRFMQPSLESMRGRQIEQDVHFKMIICSFDAEAKVWTL